jgi:uncharacterized repeat protein (TIGR02543 family)
MRIMLSSSKHRYIGKRELKKLFSTFFLTLFLMGTLSLALNIEQPCARATMAQSEVTGGLDVLEYHLCDVPTETVYVSSEPRNLYYHAHIQLRSMGGELYETSLNVTDVVDMPSTVTTGAYDVQPSPTSNGPDWFYWNIGTLKETIYFDDQFHIHWNDQERTTLESLGFSVSRNLTTPEIPAEKDSINQTIFIEIRPVEKDKVLCAGAEYRQDLISAELLECNYKENVGTPGAFMPYNWQIEWRIEPPLEDVYIFQATFKLTRKPGVTGIVEVFPRFRGDLRVETREQLPSAYSVSTSFEVGNLSVANRNSVDWTVWHEKSRTVFFTAREAAVHDLAISSTAGGSVTSPGEGTITYDDGTVVNLVATPAIGYQFKKWTGDVDTIANVNAASTTITMNGDYSITANFEQIWTYELTISSTAGGNVTTPGEGTFTYNAGTVVNLVATPATGYHFVNWTGDVDTIADVNDATTTIIMNGDYTITANFEKTTGICFIATAAYGTPMAEEIQILREFRDEYLLTNPAGQAMVDFYYRVSPPMAEFITEHPNLKPIVRAGLVPAVTMSAVAVNTSPAEKMAIIGLLGLVSVTVAVWAKKRRGRRIGYS